MNLIVRRNKWQLATNGNSDMKWYSLWTDLEHGPPSWIGSWIGWIWSNKSLYYFLISLIWFLTFVRTAALQLSFTLALKLNGLILMVHNRYWLNVSNYCRNGGVLTAFCHNRNKLTIKSQCATYNFTTMSTFEFWTYLGPNTLIIRHRSTGCELPHFIYNHTTGHGFFPEHLLGPNTGYWHTFHIHRSRSSSWRPSPGCASFHQ